MIIHGLLMAKVSVGGNLHGKIIKFWWHFIFFTKWRLGHDTAKKTAPTTTKKCNQTFRPIRAGTCGQMTNIFGYKCLLKITSLIMDPRLPFLCFGTSPRWRKMWRQIVFGFDGWGKTKFKKKMTKDKIDCLRKISMAAMPVCLSVCLVFWPMSAYDVAHC